MSLINTIYEDYCSFELSKVLKEKGFYSYRAKNYFREVPKFERVNFDTFKQADWDEVDVKTIYTPQFSHALALKWIRVNFNLIITIYANASGYLFEVHDTPEKGGSHKYDSEFTGPNDCGTWNSFEEATEAALLYTLSHSYFNK